LNRSWSGRCVGARGEAKVLFQRRHRRTNRHGKRRQVKKHASTGKKKKRVSLTYYVTKTLGRSGDIGRRARRPVKGGGVAVRWNDWTCLVSPGDPSSALRSADTPPVARSLRRGSRRCVFREEAANSSARGKSPWVVSDRCGRSSRVPDIIRRSRRVFRSRLALALTAAQRRDPPSITLRGRRRLRGEAGPTAMGRATVAVAS